MTGRAAAIPARWWFADLRPALSVTLDPWAFPEPSRPPAVAPAAGPRPMPGWKREALLAVIEASPGASDREIGRIAGVDHKTVAAYRKRGGPPSGQKDAWRLRAAAIIACGEKWCPGCGEVRSLQAFARAASRLDGRQGHCRRCMAGYKTGQPRQPRPRAGPWWPPGWDEEAVAAAGVTVPPPPPPPRTPRRAPVPPEPPSLASLAAWGGLAGPVRRRVASR